MNSNAQLYTHANCSSSLQFMWDMSRENKISHFKTKYLIFKQNFFNVISSGILVSSLKIEGAANMYKELTSC